MPQRTNDFQKLVELIYRLFAPQNAKVTASAMVKSASGQDREVDVLVEIETELYPVRIAVEAKDLSRPIETTTLEQYIGKYNSPGGVTVDKVIIVAKSFANTVVDRAQSLGFELHTLKSLESSEIGEFSKPQQGVQGCWWVGKELGNRVNLSLFTHSGHLLGEMYHNGRMMKRKSHTHLGTPLSWAKNAVDGFLGEQVNRLYSEHAGESIHLLITIGFEEHTVDLNGFRAVRLAKMVLDFGEHMKFPEMQTGSFELSANLRRTKRIVHEKGHGKNAVLNLVYEDAAGLPAGVQLHAEPIDRNGQPLEIKRVEITIDSREVDATTTVKLINDASSSW